MLEGWNAERIGHLVQRYEAVGVGPGVLAGLLAQLQALQLQLLSSAMQGTWLHGDPVPLLGDRVAIAPALKQVSEHQMQGYAVASCLLPSACCQPLSLVLLLSAPAPMFIAGADFC